MTASRIAELGAAYIRGATWSLEMGMRYRIEELHKAARDYADKLSASPPPAALGVEVEALRAAAKAFEAHCAATAAMNAARPGVAATPAERTLYQERFQAHHATEREHWSTAIRLAHKAARILAPLPQPSPEVAAAPSVSGVREALHDAAVAIEALLANPTDESRYPHAKHYAERAWQALASEATPVAGDGVGPFEYALRAVLADDRRPTLLTEEQWQAFKVNAFAWLIATPPAPADALKVARAIQAEAEQMPRIWLMEGEAERLALAAIRAKETT